MTQQLLGRTLHIGPVSPDQAHILDELRLRFHSHQACTECWPSTSPGAPGSLSHDDAFLAVKDGEAVGAAWLVPGAGESGVGLAVDPAHPHAARLLLEAVAETARARGFGALHVTVPLEDTICMSALNGAGFRITSATSYGGVTRVGLSVARAVGAGT